MSLISIETALHHLRADPDDAADVQLKLEAAIEMAEQFIGRRIYASYPEVLTAAQLAMVEMEMLLAEKETIKNSYTTDSLKEAQLERVNSRWYDMLMTARGIPTNKAIEAAILLTLGTLYEHREDVVVGTSIVKLPQGAEYRLQPYRVMGV